MRSATYEDVVAFYDGNITAKRLSTRATIAFIDDYPIALGGLAYMSGWPWAFCDLRPEARPYRTGIHRTALNVLAHAKTHHRFILAEKNEDEPTADRWLTRLGFKTLPGINYYIWER